MLNLDFLFSAVLSVGTIGIIVFFHELGHYLVARINGANIKEFSIGFGPDLLVYIDKRKTKWTIKWFPLGGYVSCVEDRLGFFARIFLYLGGPVGNLVFSILVSFFVFYHSGLPKQYSYIDGKEIVSINKIENDYEMVMSNGAKMNIKSEELNEIKGRIRQEIKYSKVNLLQSAVYAVKYSWNLFTQTAKHLIYSIKNFSLKLSGPISVMRATNKVFKEKSYVDMLHWMIVLSIGLGVINLIPIMPLDGGRILHEILGLINKRFAHIFSAIAIYFALGVMIFVLFGDIKILLRGLI